MKRLPIPVFLLSLLLIATACSMPYIADIPEWMTGDWDIFSESGEYIGRCEIDTWSIDITIDSYGSYEQFDLLSQAMQNGGWSESKEGVYSLYAEYSGNVCYRFLQSLSQVMLVELNADNYIVTFQLHKR